MSDLSDALTDAAAAAIGAAVHMPGSRAQAQEAVAAVLETLADQCPSPNGWWLTLEELRQVAAEAKGEEGR